MNPVDQWPTIDGEEDPFPTVYVTPIGLYLGPLRLVEKQDDCWPSKEERQRQASVAIHEQFEQINLQLHDIRCELAKLHDRLDAHGITLKRMSTRDNTEEPEG